MRRRSVWLVLLVCCAASALLAVACGGASGPTGPTPNQIAAQTAKSVGAAKTLHLKGSVKNGAPLTIDVILETDADGNATFTGTGRDGVPFTMVVVDGKTYLKGAQFWTDVLPDAGEARAFGDKWVLLQPDDAEYGGDMTTLVPTLRDLMSLRTAHGKFTGGRKVTVDGRKAIELKMHGATYDVAASGAHKLLRVASSSDPIEPSRMSDVRVDVDYDAPLSATAPSPFLDASDQSTWPARYDVDADASTGDCNQFSCTLNVGATNDGGAPEGQSVVTITAETPGGDPIASCQAPVPALPNGGSTTVSCAVTGDAWTNFVDSNAPEGGFAQFQTEVSLHNPPYDA